ncbi:MAG: extracellular solute-binding protein [Eubacteriales bacterium]|nr:extracellular solute-binding protein [Eubacteriales bacterium]
MRKNSKRWLSILLAGTMSIMALTGCSGESSEKPAARAAESESAGAEEAKDDKEVTLSLLNSMTPGEGTAISYRAVLSKFEEENPNIHLDEETIANADMATKVQTLAAADELPDIFMLKGQMVKNFVENGKVLCVDDILNEDPEWRDSFKDGIFSNYIVDGKTYGIPYQITNTCVFYNKDLFAKAGVENFPKTWDEFIEAVKKIKASGVTPIVLGNKAKWNAESVIMSTLGNRCTGDEWYQSIRDKNGASFTDPEFVASLQALANLADAGAFNTDVNSLDNIQQRQVYMNGEAAMSIDGSWTIVEFDNNAPQEILETTEVAALPMVDGGKGNPDAITGGSGWAYAVNANIDPAKLPAVKKYLRAVAGVEFANEMAKIGTNTVIEPTENNEGDPSKVVATKFNEFQKGRQYIPVYDHQLSSGIMDVMQSGLQELLIGRISAEELAQKIQEEYARD